MDRQRIEDCSLGLAVTAPPGLGSAFSHSVVGIRAPRQEIPPDFAQRAADSILDHLYSLDVVLLSLHLDDERTLVPMTRRLRSTMHMRTSASMLLFLMGALAAVHCAGGEVLPPFGQLPDSGKTWKLREQGKYGSPSFQWHWVILTNSETADVLSYAAHRLEPGESRELIHLSDPAHEIFPAGDPTWTAAPRPHLTGHPIRNRVTKLDLSDSTAKRDLSQEALEYSFVQEEERGTNRLAHGYALVFDDVAVYIQHTSTKIITSEFAHDRAVSLLSTRFANQSLRNASRP
jgi:hypothetical protein